MRLGNIQAVVLAGGLGTRLRPYTLFLPKPMLPLGDKPVLEHTLEWLKKNGVSDIVLCVGYLRRVIEDYFKDGEEFGVKISYARGNRPLGIAGQLKTARPFLNGTFICLYADMIFDFPLRAVVDFHVRRRALATIVVMPYKTTLRYGFVDLDEKGSVKDWREKPEVSGLINVGCYVMEPRFLEYIPSAMVSMDGAFRTALKSGELICAYRGKGDFIDIGDRRAYTSASERFLERLGKIL